TSNDSSRDFAYGIGISPQNVIYALGSFVNEVSFSDVSMTSSSGNSDPLIVRLNNEDGSQSFFDNSLAGSQDGDIDSSNELQDISLNGSLLSISNGSEVDLSHLSLSTAAFSTENGLTQSTSDSDDFLFGAAELDNTSGTQQTKFFFDNVQGAFRVGSVLDDNWNQDSLGFASIGLGIDVLATGANTIALGSGTVASGNTSTAIGSSTAASGNFSTALGASTEASGNFSTALGFLTTASGQNSTALGSRTEALSFAEVATGVYNTDYAPNNTTSFDEDDRLFVIGNGESATSKSDALLVYKNGNTEINGLLTVDPNNDDMGYTFPANSPLSGQLLMVNSLGELIWDYNGAVSDERLKENIRILPDALDKLDALNGYYFYWKSSSADTSRQVGVMAQELEQVLPELVHYDSEGYRSVDYASMAAFLIQVNKEQEARINAQQAEIEELKKQTAKINQLEAMLHQLQAQVDNNSTSTNSTDDE
ncbi:MAG: tail fiber domain-containing protein, partial [Bacteroidota bacterium]